jgi:hypothetical protein
VPSLIEDISNFQYYKYTGFTENLEKFFKFVKGNEDNNIEKCIWGHLLSHIHENPLKTKLDLLLDNHQYG